LSNTYFHTQEARPNKLSKAVICKRDDAWLGEAYYFWYDESDADHWGNSSKKRTGKYQVYKAEIDKSDVLDTVFNEDHYLFWLNQIEKIAKNFIKKTHIKPTLKELNEYMAERGLPDEITGVQFQDLHTNPDFNLVQPIQYQYKKVTFSYKKRIQIAVYNYDIVTTFAFLKQESCI